jgi:hypothetical protein
MLGLGNPSTRTAEVHVYTQSFSGQDSNIELPLVNTQDFRICYGLHRDNYFCCSFLNSKSVAGKIEMQNFVIWQRLIMVTNYPNRATMQRVERRRGI